MISHGLNGYLVKDRDKKELAEYMIRFTKDRVMAEKMSSYAYSNVQKFNLDAIRDRWISLIESL